MALKDYSATAGNNTTLGGITLDGGTMTVSQLDNAIRALMADIAAQGVHVVDYEGADMASAATTNLANATGRSLDITGTTTITAFGTVDAGRVFILRFTGVLTLTHNATSLILPGAANITTAAGDVAFMKSEGSGNWRCILYQRASGRAVVTGLPSSSTDNAAARYDGTSGAFQDSGVIIDDSNNMTIGTGTYTGGALTLSSAGPNINFTDTDTGGDSRIQGNSATGSLTYAADVNNEIANSVHVWQIDGNTVGTWSATGLTINGTLTVTG